jgi:hypothetical protein
MAINEIELDPKAVVKNITLVVSTKKLESI